MRAFFNKYKYELIIVLVVTLVNGVYLLVNNMTNTDEFSSLAAAAILAGRDWTPLTSYAGYHGFGMTILLTPFFKLINDGIIVYKIALIGCLLLRIICTYLSFKLANRLFGLSELNSVIVSLLCNFGMLSSDDGAALSVMTEVPITFLCLLFVWFVFNGIQRKKRVYFVFSAIALAYGSLIHSRILIVYASVVLLCIVCLLRKKAWLNCVFFWLAFLIAYLGFSQFSNYVIDLTYGGRSTTELITTTTGIATTRLGKYFGYFFNAERVRLFFTTFISQLGAYTFYSFGFIWIFVFTGVRKLIAGLRRKESTNLDYSIDLLILFGLFSFFGMIFSISLSSTGAVANGNYRWFTYLRYSMPYAWIVTLTGISLIFSEEKVSRNVILSSCVVSIVMAKFFITITCRILDESAYKMSYSIFNRFFYQAGDTATSYYSRYLIWIFVALFVVAFINNKYLHAVIYVFLSLGIYVGCCRYFYYQDMSIGESYNITKIVLNNEIFREDTYINIIGNKKYQYNIQLAIQDKSFVPIQEENMVFDVAISNTPMRIEGVYEYMLDTKEYIYIKDLNKYNQLIRWMN